MSLHFAEDSSMPSWTRKILSFTPRSKDWSNRLNLLSTFVLNAGFVTKNQDKVFENPTKLGDFLGVAGPFDAGGELSRTAEFDDPNPGPAMQEVANALKIPDDDHLMRGRSVGFALLRRIPLRRVWAVGLRFVRLF
jgi:hypothetical protein